MRKINLLDFGHRMGWGQTFLFLIAGILAGPATALLLVLVALVNDDIAYRRGENSSE